MNEEQARGKWRCQHAPKRQSGFHVQLSRAHDILQAHALVRHQVRTTSGDNNMLRLRSLSYLTRARESRMMRPHVDGRQG